MENAKEKSLLEGDILRLESQLFELKSRLTKTKGDAHHIVSTSGTEQKRPESLNHSPLRTSSGDLGLYIPATSHSLLLLSDSALPLGSFAFSSGLESYIAHHKSLPPDITAVSSFHRFLKLSMSSMAGMTVPYILSAYRYPEDLERWDNDLDASTLCTVARRASVAQGRALLSVWERAFRSTTLQTSQLDLARTSLDTLSSLLRTGPSSAFGPNCHFAPIWALVCLSMGLSIHQTAYLFLFNHVKALLSAAVRASVMGPYQAQAILASPQLQAMITDGVEKEWERKPEDAGQVVPLLDFWVGRHELLYSRIFNS
ncbi:MAG: hypothetical protein M1834_000305 [Cirrosporium novae-zelandiae]|nr:MAG: hypothetical protein M1834_000305 [Cirrosporium novae-zelandiae]